ncbi:MAG: CRISPR-associated protein Cas4 [Desulfovibrio sp.]|jgi:CRISPR-associated exonuclease Cas4|nr:CRISPR-associated protein Cas4 [Desulfovibrio sp.]
MYAPADLIPISALQHYLYCPRQCALIHLEQIWEENLYTAEGRLLHRKVDRGGREARGDVKIVAGLPLRSLALGITGKADVVEFHRREGVWHPFPVEYKRGMPKKHDADKIQLCAQAICLEEMLDLPVPEGALFYGKTRRRLEVMLNAVLREAVRETAEAVHTLMRQGVTPSPAADERCSACSLADQCLPRHLSRRDAASRYLQSLQAEI